MAAKQATYATAVPVGGAPMMAAGQQVYVGGQPVVLVQSGEAVVMQPGMTVLEVVPGPPPAVENARSAAATAGFVALVNLVLLAIASGGPWWMMYIGNLFSVQNYAWGWGECWSTYWAGYATCNTYSDYTSWQAKLALLNPAAGSAFTWGVYNTLRAGSGLLGVAACFAFLAMIASFSDSWSAGTGGACMGGSVVLHALTFVCALVGAAVAGAGVQQAQWPSLLTYSVEPAPTGSSISGSFQGWWGYGWGMGCAVAGCVLSFINALGVCAAASAAKKAGVN